jgi:outer membrane protein assembly factor BamE
MRILLAIALSASIASCAVIDPLVYKIDIPQGNYLEQRDVDKLRVGMTREQVRFVLGSPVAENVFRDEEWNYIFRLKPGRGDVITRELTVRFEGDHLASIEGDFKPHEDFNTPIDS